MNKIYLWGGLAVLVFILAIFLRFPTPTLEEQLLDLTNSDRVAQGLNALTTDPQLQAAAKAKVSNMVMGGYFRHVSPQGEDSWFWFNQAGYIYRLAGENLAEGFDSATSTEAAFMASPTHRANIFKPGYTDIGIATEKGRCIDVAINPDTGNAWCGNDLGKEVTFVVVMYGSRL